MSPVHRNTSEISSLGRATVLLREFLRPVPYMTVEHLVRSTDLPKTTVHRMVDEMLRLGWLSRGECGLQLGTVFFELGQMVPAERTLREAAKPSMQDLQQATQQNVGLAVLDGAEVVYLEALPGRDAPRLPQRVGGRWPAHASCSGKAMLAFAAEPVLQAVQQAGLRQLTPKTITSMEGLLAELAKIRLRGLAFDRQESFETVNGIAAPLRNSAGQVIAALAISGRAGRINLERCEAALAACASSISRTIAAAVPGKFV
ncbi:IclR family transcriptional regulator [Psychromicrobium lacuslunae]|uniref:IclR-ED domain-containing protein n=1 Tax=Psychromicrobium lacuslunae TaxID=1618207 RepID=A0A0D4BXT9_9MICC|nr:IclR family transcriptional regulator [Psychromicrobium lacuslunae]AJT41272.1 hypothetical protein UM93_06590 [Psychromicrobium lacuslunae]